MPQKKPARLPRKVHVGLRQIDSLLDDGRIDRARQIAVSLNEQFPDRPPILHSLADVHLEAGDLVQYEAAVERLSQLEPDDPDIWFDLSRAYFSNRRPMLGVDALRRFVERWPDDERAGEARQMLADLEPIARQILVESEMDEDDFDFAVLHDQMQAHLDRQDTEQLRRAAEQMLARRPDFAPAQNNISLSHFIDGDLDAAVAAAEWVLAGDADNVHALSNLIHYLCAQGRLDEARRRGEQLKAADSGDKIDASLKKAEAFSYLGDDTAVLDAFDEARQSGALATMAAAGYLYHLAAVAAYRQGDEETARRYWEQALEETPNLTVADENLADLDRPIGQRHAAWPFPTGQWLSSKGVAELLERFGDGVGRSSFAKIQRHLERHVEMNHLVPMLLDRGDPFSRQFAATYALTAETPEMVDALFQFAVSQRGPDDLRMRALQGLQQAEKLPANQLKLWINGEWQVLSFLGFEITGEPSENDLDPEAQELLEEAIGALNAGRFQAAEALLRQALSIAPGDPSLLNNLAAAYGNQGREDEAMALVRQIHEAHPDYLFARIALARQQARNEQFEEAHALLAPLLERQKLHFTEFAALADAKIELAVLEESLEAARNWLAMWADVEPDHERVVYWQQLLEGGRRWRN